MTCLTVGLPIVIVSLFLRLAHPFDRVEIEPPWNPPPDDFLVAPGSHDHCGV